jgi:hypothetical protein
MNAGPAAVSDTGRTPTQLCFHLVGLFSLLRPPLENAIRRLRPSLGNGRLPDFHCKGTMPFAHHALNNLRSMFPRPLSGNSSVKVDPAGDGRSTSELVVDPPPRAAGRRDLTLGRRCFPCPTSGQ